MRRESDLERPRNVWPIAKVVAGRRARCNRSSFRRKEEKKPESTFICLQFPAESVLK